MTTRSQVVANDIVALLRARSPLIWIITREEARVEEYVTAAAESLKYVTRTWDVAQGICNIAGRQESWAEGSQDLTAPGFGALPRIRERAESKSADRCVWIMRDLHKWLDGMPGAQAARGLRNLARLLPTCDRDQAQAIVVLSPSAAPPEDLAAHATVIDWPLPDREELSEILDACIAVLPDGLRDQAANNGTRDAAVDAAIGLTGIEAQSCYAKSLAQFKKIVPAEISKEKKRVIAKEGVLEWFDPLPGGLDAVGGLEPLKAWLKGRAAAYTPAARAYGLKAPKGGMFVGPPGTGKSLTAKAIATAWNVPLIKMDPGALKGKFVGESEAKIRKALQVADTVGRCVLWLDEIEKSLGGAIDGGADGGVSTDQLGTILGWMQEHKSEVFVVATANDVSKLPPELMRKGRFDDIWFVDVPTKVERMAILTAALKANDRAVDDIDLDVVAEATEGFVGAEIAGMIPEAMFAAYAEGARPLYTGDLINAALTVTPLSVSMGDKLTRLREWGKSKARAANAATVAEKAKVKVSVLDI
jgi:ATPase family associated with various cellular activities (AAA)/AAA+ lid domain